MKVDVQTMRNAVTLAATQYPEVSVRPGSGGWDMVVLSPDHTTMVQMTVHKDAFTDYEVWDEFAFDTGDMLEALSTAKDGVDIDISTGRLVMRSDGMTYRRRILVPEEKRPRIPSLDLSTHVVTPVDRLLQLISKGEKKHGRVVMSTDIVSFCAAVEDEQGLGVTLEIPADECGVLEGGARSQYSVGSWAAYLKAIPKGTMLDITYDTDYPLVSRYSVGNLDTMWMIAPYIERD